MPIDHWVPQFYLRNFAVPGQPGRIFSYRRNLQPRNMGIRSVASAEDYCQMRTNIPGVDRNQFDRIFGDLEAGTSPIITHLLTAQNTQLEENDRGVLAFFIAIQAFRTPQGREQLMRMHANQQLRNLERFANNEGQFHEAARAAGIDAEAAELARQLVFNPDNGLFIEYRGGETEDYFMVRAVEAADAVCDILLAKHFHLLEAREPAFFITSDHPAILCTDDFQSLGNFNFRDGSMALPLSPSRSLFLSNDLISEEVISLDDDEVRRVGELVVRSALEAVFADRESQEIQLSLNDAPIVERVPFRP
jgi:hypothetical protein